MDKKRKYLKSALEAKDFFYNADDFGRYLQEIAEGRKDKKTKSIIDKYGKNLITKTAMWFQDLSEQEKREHGLNDVDMEPAILAYLQECPNEVTVRDYEKAIGRDKVKPLVPDESLDTIPYPMTDEQGRIVPSPKIKLKKSPPPMPSEEQASRMRSDDLAKVIRSQGVSEE